MKSLFEEMGGTYRQEGDYRIPNIVLLEAPQHPLGKYGRMRREHLKKHHSVIYNKMVLDGSLYPHLYEIDKSCNARMEKIVSDMARNEGVTESLKEQEQMLWVQRMNSIQHRAEEIILYELVYD